MILRKGLLTGIAMLASGSISAEASTLKIRAGEHGAYSRIVIPTGPAGQTGSSKPDVLYTALTINNGVLRLPVPPADYDLSDIIGARKAHRVASARIAGSLTAPVMELDVNCDCKASATQNADQSIVIDISPIDASDVAGAPIDIKKPVTDVTQAENPADRSAEIARARARLLALLNEADEKGYVNIADAQTPEPQASTRNSRPVPAEQSLNTAPHSTSAQPANQYASACPTDRAIDALKASAAFDFDDIISLQKALHESVEDDRPNTALAIVGGYLQLGLLDEADKIASDWLAATARDGGAQARRHDFAFLRRVIALSKHIEFPNAIFERDLPLQAFDASCAPEIAAIRQSLDLIEREAIATPDSLPPALLTLAPSLRGPLLSRLALIAYNQGDEAALANLLHHAETAYRLGQPSTTVQYLKSITSRSADTIQHDALIQTISDTDHPLKSQVLVDRLATLEADDADLTPTLLDDVARHAEAITGDAASRRLVSEGAEALVKNGRVDDALALLGSAARALPEYQNQYTNAIGDIVSDAVNADNPGERIAAASAFVDQLDTLEMIDPELRTQAAAIAATLGLSNVLDQLFDDMAGTGTPAQAQLRAQAHYHAGDFATVSAIADQFPDNPDLAVLDLRARRQAARASDDPQSTASAIEATRKRAVQDHIASPALASEAFLAREWQAARDIFDLSLKQPFSDDDYRRMLLANYMSGNIDAVRKPAIAERQGFDDTALRHFVVAPPPFNRADRAGLKSFSQNLTDEITLIETELAR